MKKILFFTAILAIMCFGSSQGAGVQPDLNVPKIILPEEVALTPRGEIQPQRFQELAGAHPGLNEQIKINANIAPNYIERNAKLHIDSIVQGNGYSSKDVYRYSYYETGEKKNLVHEIYGASTTYDWKKSWKGAYTFNKNGQIILETYYNSPIDSNEWVVTRQYEYIYDENGILEMSAGYAWSSDSNDWVPFEKREWTHDKNGKNVLNTVFKWSIESNDWIGEYQIESIYDETGNKTLEYRYYWSSENNEWEVYWKTEYAYEDNGKIRTITNYQLLANGWVEQDKREYTYDENGNQILESYYTWSSDFNEWVGKYKYENLYDQNGKVILLTGYTWSSDSNDWVKSSICEYAYDEYGNLVLISSCYRLENTNEWYGSYKEESAYDENGNMILYVAYAWSKEAKDWVRNYKFEYSYEDWMADWIDIVTLGLSVYYIWQDEEWVLMTYQDDIFDEDTLVYSVMMYNVDGTPTGNYTNVYFSNSHLSGIADVNQEAAIAISGRTIFPLNETVSVYNLGGCLVARSIGEPINMAEPGIYIVVTPFEATKVVIR